MQRLGRVFIVIVVVVGWVIGSLNLTAQTAQDRLSQLEERIHQLEAQLADLKAEVRSLRAEAKPSPASDNPSVNVALSERGLVVESPDRTLGLRFSGMFQVEGRTYFGDARRLAVDTMEPRRIRPVVEMTAGLFSFRVAPELTGTTQDLRDAYGTFNLSHGLQLSFGKMKPPIGLERLQAAATLPLAERGLTAELIPVRDIGLMLKGLAFDGNLEYAVGLFDGASDGANPVIDLNSGKDIDFRAFLHPWRPARASSGGLGIGLGGNVGNQTGLPRAYSSSAHLPFFSYFPGTVTDGKNWRLSPQADFYLGSLGLMAEYVRSSQRVFFQGTDRTLANSAWNLRGSYVLTGEPAAYSGVRPRSLFRPGEGTWGAFEVAARISRLNIDHAAFPLFADPAISARQATGFDLGLNWYLSRLIRFTFDYETLSFDLPAGRRPREHALTSRLQFAY